MLFYTPFSLLSHAFYIDAWLGIFIWKTFDMSFKKKLLFFHVLYSTFTIKRAYTRFNDEDTSSYILSVTWTYVKIDIFIKSDKQKIIGITFNNVYSSFLVLSSLSLWTCVCVCAGVSMNKRSVKIRVLYQFYIFQEWCFS